jgi:hypothetical protein
LTPIRFRFIQVLFEAAIPIIGYFYWNWTFYYILLFYLLDLLASTGFILVKAKKIGKIQTNAEKAKPFHLISSPILFSGGILLAAGTILNLYPDFSFYAETVKFILLKDMGIAQGIFLIPLVIYAAYMNYKTQFLLQKKHHSLSLKGLFFHYFKGMLLFVFGFFMAYCITFFIQVPEIISVLIFVLAVSVYSFFEKHKY